MNRPRTLAVAALALSLTASARACPMCKDAAPFAASTADATATPETAGLDFSTSIYVMLGVVTAVGTVVGRVMYKAVRA